MNLLHIYSSTSRQPSISSQTSDRIVDALRLAKPALKVIRRNLEADPLPDQGPIRPGVAAQAAERRERQLREHVLDEFLKADVIVIGAPTHDSTIARQLKAWIDRVVAAGKTFDMTPEGVHGLASGKKVIVASSRARDAAETPIDFQEAFLRAELGFIGINSVEFVRPAAPKLVPPRKHVFRSRPKMTERLEPTIAA